MVISRLLKLGWHGGQALGLAALLATCTAGLAQTASKAFAIQESERLLPQARSQSLPPETIAALKRDVMEPFLSAPRIVDAAQYAAAPRVVAGPENRGIMAAGDRIFARSSGQNPATLTADAGGDWSIYRDARTLKDPVTGASLGLQAQLVGHARLLSGEGSEPAGGEDKEATVVVPAALELRHTLQEIRVGDRLFPRTQARWQDIVPQWPTRPVRARVVSIYGNAVHNAGQNQIVVIDQGTTHGIEPGYVLGIERRADLRKDASDTQQPLMRMPTAANGVAMVFLCFDTLSYALLTRVTDSVRVGDQLARP